MNDVAPFMPSARGMIVTLCTPVADDAGKVSSSCVFVTELDWTLMAPSPRGRAPRVTLTSGPESTGWKKSMSTNSTSPACDEMLVLEVVTTEGETDKN